MVHLGTCRPGMIKEKNCHNDHTETPLEEAKL